MYWSVMYFPYLHFIKLLSFIIHTGPTQAQYKKNAESNNLGARIPHHVAN